MKSDFDCRGMVYFMNKELSDVTFIIEEQRLPALKALLSSKSKVFRAMFSGQFKEAKDKEVVIEDTTYMAFKTLILFLYCDRLVLEDVNDFELIREVCKLSDRYEAIELMRKIAKMLDKIELTFDNFTSISKIAFGYKFEELMSKVRVFIDTNIYRIAKYFYGEELTQLNESTDGYLLYVLATRFPKQKP